MVEKSHRAFESVDWDWFDTGVWDCEHAFERADFEQAFDAHMNEGSAAVVDAVMSGDEWNDLDGWADTYSNEIEDAGIDGDDVAIAYEEWKDGWRSRAVRYVARWIDEERRSTDAYFVVANSDGGVTGELVETFTDVGDALDALVKLDAPIPGAENAVRFGTLAGWDPQDRPVAIVDYRGKVLGSNSLFTKDVLEWQKRHAMSNPAERHMRKNHSPGPPRQVIEKLAEYDTEFGWRPESRADAIRKLSEWRDEANEAILKPHVQQERGRYVWFKSIVNAFDELGPSEADRIYLNWVFKRNPRKNPTEDTKRAAVGKFKEFWRQEPTKIGEFPSSFKIPTRMHKLGKAVHILYESKKTDPETLKKPKKPLSYIHEHDFGVQICDTQGPANTDIPEFIVKAPALVCLGQCLGFKWFGEDDGEEHEAEGTDPLPDVWCTVDGRALLIVQSRRTVLHIIWGGSLGVEARGIVG